MMAKLKAFWKTYGKTISALAIGLVGWGTVVVNSASAPVTAPEWIGLATVMLTALGVYSAPSAQKPPPGP
jgi:hypothetical protein